ncbi:MAG TPA: VOC family protein [Saprospiraceae bacterium]|nr:VOC family protein [Saprospiraceae bacterium]HMP23503.1 VOC family protein [Saprospiraceae bacterium]
MKNKYITIVGLLASFAIGYYLNTIFAQKPENANIEKTKTEKQNNMKLGAFSISLSVKDLKTSKEFYEKLGFNAYAGSMEQNYLIMKNDNALIGLFQGMFQGNILTFNPGWDENANNIENFDDIREIQKQLKTFGLALTSEADEKTEGPASLMLTDPDGNVILLDQHR